ncbi:MAG: response regulator transcription factor [Firmicutes bacterium]|nr:response regulator transcription factor [Bacillota bacterium]
MFKILVVDDEPKIRELIVKYGKFDGHEVVEAENGLDALNKVKNENFDVIVMDVMMPELDGFTAVKEIRKFSNTPVLMLSARGEEYDKIHGFEVGIDDYVVKPFSPKELMMRIEAILRRGKSLETERDIFTYNGLKIDFTARSVFIDDHEIQLFPREYDLLFYMVKNKGIALTREKLLNKVWGYDYFGNDRTLDTHVKLLRKSLGNYADCIKTLRGVGYRFEINE